MKYSVGILYSSQDFLQIVSDKKVEATSFRATFRTFGLAHSEDVIDACQRFNWIKINEDGFCEITDSGEEIVLESDKVLALRLQLRNIIKISQPSWVNKMKSGRKEVEKFLSSEINQIFKEAGLYNNWTDELIDWWDELTLYAYSASAYERMKTGRAAEHNTIIYEEERVVEKPTWVALNSNFMGYDVLSIPEQKSTDKLLIEVKGSTQKFKEATFTLTRHEWNIGKESNNYIFYLWILKYPLQLVRVPFSVVEAHIPIDQMSGQWQNVRIPYSSFKSHKVDITPNDKYTHMN